MSNTEDRAEDQARAQVRSIVERVAALECDYDRLEELRDERSDYEASPMFNTWEEANPEEAAELSDLEEAAGECTSEDEARQRIHEDALSVEVRSDWCSPGEEMTAGEFRILLCTGGPHVELVGDLDQGEPSRVRVLYRDWGTSGELFDFDHNAVLTYCRAHYFGE